METNHFSLLFSRVTADLPIPAEQQQSAVTAAQNTFEESRRQGASIQDALESAESTLLETVTPVLEAASRLKDILATDFESHPELASQPHFPRLLQKFLPLLVEPQSRLADTYITGLIIEYTEKDVQHGL
ncbi:hypothetical protein BN8_p06804 (plasmid) [Fibrisoma limi BUZ 3]|uniref:Uncharacterized protein n=1 Tax=Fibrisoma limi BUZ 3 TaxID=1185876 RepID=I2GU07_9BACT|nr:hypothetical protein [Fibrisoma limi]CCH57608.1 hypothetical protein BN8_p06804 [Fibrisoma limi BUZ 3]